MNFNKFNQRIYLVVVLTLLIAYWQPVPLSQAASPHLQNCIMIQYGQTYANTIDQVGEQHCYTFSGLADQRITVYLKNLDGGSPTYTSLSLELLKPDGGRLAYLSHSSGDRQLDNKTLPDPGVYTVLVDGYQNELGDYELIIVRHDNNQRAITYEQTLTGEITLIGEQDTFTFNGVAGQRITAYLENLDGGSPTYTSLSLELLKPDGGRLDYLSHSSGDRQLDNKLLENTGEHRVVIDGDMDELGDYKITIVRHDNNQRAITYEQTLTDEITLIGEQDTFTFNGVAGQRITVYLENLDGGSPTYTSLSLELLKPDGGRLAYLGHSSADRQLDNKLLENTGEHRVVIDGDMDELGDYKITIVRHDNNQQPIAYNQTVDGRINLIGEQDTFTFYGTKDQRVTAYLKNLDGGSPTYTSLSLELLKPDGSRLDYLNHSSGDRQLDNKLLENTGEHRIVIDGYMDELGDYELTLTCIWNCPETPDLSLTISDNPDPVTVNSSLTYAVTVQNNNSETATGVILTDNLPTSVTFTSASSGCNHANGTVTCNLGTINGNAEKSVTIVVRPNQSGTITNQASVILNEPDDNPNNNSASVTTVVNDIARPDLTVSLSDSPDPVEAGKPLTYQLTIQNVGNQQATGVTLVNTLPTNVNYQSNSNWQRCYYFNHQVICHLGILSSQASTALSIVVVPTEAGQITNQAEVSSNESDTNPNNNRASITTVVTAPEPTPPKIIAIRPNQGKADVPNTINIDGSGFVPGSKADLDSESLTTTYIHSGHLQAIVPAGMTPGVYDLTVTNPGGLSDTLADAYTVLAAGVDDLYAHSTDLWTDPPALKAGILTDVGLVVRRYGGKNALQNVKVRFYLGNPGNGGTLLGEDVISLLSPRSNESAVLELTSPLPQGRHLLYAIIDPDHAIVESNEGNNHVWRHITVGPAPADKLPPRVDQFSINNDAAETSNRNVQFDTTVSDPLPSSGVQSILFREFEYSQAAEQWVLSQESGWLDYTTAKENYNWTLTPAAGVKCIQAWAADGAGNISVFPHLDFITYVPPIARVMPGQAHSYRYWLQAGETMTVRLVPLSGDPDLYVWPPDKNQSPWVSNLENGVDAVSFVAPLTGSYQVEVFGYTNASYQLEVQRDAANKQAIATPADEGGISENKVLLAEPILSPNSEPSNRGEVTDVSVEQKIFIPIVAR